MISPTLTLGAEDWLRTRDGFRLCRVPLSVLLHRMDISDTGISPINSRDVDSYLDDWHLYSVGESEPHYSLIKLREQEHDYVPGFADKDDPAVTVSFQPFPLETLEALPRWAGADDRAMRRFVESFRDVTERFTVPHDPVLQRYFSDPASEAGYLIGETYVQKILALNPGGRIPLPDKFAQAPKRLLDGLRQLTAGTTIFCPEEGCLEISAPESPTLAEQQAILAVHTCNLSYNSFAAEIQFHAEALVSWPRYLPHVGTRYWYRSAIRADMQLERKSVLYERLLCPYYNNDSSLMKRQMALHGVR